MSESTPVAKPCPICGKAPDARFQPFCSSRCADVDLQSWLTGRYAIPVAPDEEDPDDPSPPVPAGQRRRDFL